jgi:hypothetical protein
MRSSVIVRVTPLWFGTRVRLEKWAEVFADPPAEVPTAVGDTNMPFVRLVDPRPVINSGSIGCRTGLRAELGCCCATAKLSCGTRRSILMLPLSKSSATPATRAAGSGLRSISALRIAMPTPSPVLRPAMAVSSSRPDL